MRLHDKFRGSDTVRAGIAIVLSLLATSPAVLAQQGARRSSSEVARLVGCVELESDYRKRIDAGRGGVLGTGAGVGNEYVLTGVKARDDGAARPGAATVYSVTGRLEKELNAALGRQVEVVGFVENPDGKGPDVSDLPRISVNVWHPVADSCPK